MSDEELEKLIREAPKLTRKISWEDWQRGRAARRALSMRITGGKVLRRAEGDPRKDALLRELYNGKRGGPFASFESLLALAKPAEDDSPDSSCSRR